MRLCVAAMLIPAAGCSLFLGEDQPGDGDPPAGDVTLGAAVPAAVEGATRLSWSHSTTPGDPLTLLVAVAARTAGSGMSLIVNEQPGPAPECLFDNGAGATARVEVGVWLLELASDATAVDLRVEGGTGLWVGSSSAISPATAISTTDNRALGEANEQLSVEVDSNPGALAVGVFGWGASSDVSFELLEPHHLVNQSALGVANNGVSLAIFAVPTDDGTTLIEPSENDVGRRWAACVEVLSAAGSSE